MRTLVLAGKIGPAFSGATVERVGADTVTVPLGWERNGKGICLELAMLHVTDNYSGPNERRYYSEELSVLK